MQGFADFIDEITGRYEYYWAYNSGFSLLVGGLNSQYYVRKRKGTPINRIQKSLGAKNKFILFQFYLKP